MRLCGSALLALLVFGLASPAQGQDLPLWTPLHGAFAFPNLEGTRLLATAEIASPEALHAALCKRGSTYALAIDWGGAEGSALSLSYADDSGEFKRVLNDSWYRSPL